MKLFDKIKELARKLVSLKDTPHSVAGGAAIGIFVGFTPLFGIKTALSLALAYLLRCNPIAAVIAVSLHDIAWLVGPVLLRWEYIVGYWLLSHPHSMPKKLDLKGIHHPSEMMNIHTYFKPGFFSHTVVPTALGSFVLAVPLAAATYFLLLALLKARARRRALSDLQKP